MSENAPERDKPRNRLLSLVIVVTLVGAPAALLRGLCVGNACDEEESASSEVPFCSLPSTVRALLAAGFEGELHRSADILGVTGATTITGGTAFDDRDPQPAWPARDGGPTRVPLIFSGAGVDVTAEIPAGTGLDDVAPTIAEILDFRRPNPDVRSGEAVEGIALGHTPRLVIEVALEDVGSNDVEDDVGAWPNLRRLLDEGAGTLEAEVGSLPLDPAAALTTIGTGGLPHQHGIVGTLVRNEEGDVVRAWGPGSPIHIIATLGDHLDEKLNQEPMIGLVQSDVADRGLIGGNWYVDVDRDRIVTEARDPAQAVRTMLRSGFGDDDVPDLLAVALEGEPAFVDEQLGRIASLATGDGSASVSLVVTATGGHPPAGDMDADEIARLVEEAVPGRHRVVEAAVPGGLYLDQETLVKGEITEDDVLKPFRGLEGSDGRPLLADAFPAIAVSFARYC